MLHTIKAIALYEALNILRDWLFRIFAGLSLLIMTGLNILFFSSVSPVPYSVRSISGFIPYTNLILITIAQTAVLAFVATDIFKRDRKLDTSEVIYIRSLGNSTYIFAKTLGILGVFFLLDLLLLLVFAVLHLAFSKTGFTAAPYLIYPLVMVLPTLVFVTGLAFLLMQLIRNQAITVLLILGLLGLNLIYLGEKQFYLFDFLGAFLPLTYSDFVGIPDLGWLLLQRGMYLAFGLAFLWLSVRLFRRLPQSGVSTRLAPLFGAVLLLAGGWVGSIYLDHFNNGIRLREAMAGINQRYLQTPNLTRERLQLTLKHSGRRIQADATLTLHNRTSAPLDQFFISLNPGLQVTETRINGQTVSHSRDQHLITIRPPQAVLPGDTLRLQLNYAGRIDDQACYLDVADTTRHKMFLIYLMNKVAKKHAFIEDRFLLLTAENLWYPRVGLPEGAGFPENRQGNFGEFDLTVQCAPGMLPISQGEREDLGDGRYRFRPPYSLPRISLVIGPYREDRITVDSLSYHLYTLPSHRFFEEYFQEVGDTLPAVIREARQDYERALNLSYPFRKLELIEVPVQFYTYPRIWSVATERVQPEQAFLPENGTLLPGADFKSLDRRMNWSLDRNNQSMTDKEKEIIRFKRFVESTFTRQDALPRWMSEFGNYIPNCDIFPHFYSYVNILDSPRWPLLNAALEGYLYRKANGADPGGGRFSEGMTDEEQVSRALRDQTLTALLKSPRDSRLRTDAVQLSGEYLFKMLESERAPGQVSGLLIHLVEAHRFSIVRDSLLIRQLQQQLDLDIRPALQVWQEGKSLPAFKVRDIEMYRVQDGDRLRYQVTFLLYNRAEVPGIVEIAFRARGEGRRRGFGDFGSDTDLARTVRLGAREAREIGIVLDSEPQMIQINTVLAENLPRVFTQRFDDPETRRKAQPFDGEKVIAYLDLENPGEIVVDNEDSGFEAYNPPYRSWLKRTLLGERGEQEETYERFRSWRPPNQWEMIKNAAFFGDYVHSAHYIRSDGGPKKAIWTVPLPDAGTYDVYIYIIDKNLLTNRWERRNEWGTFNYTIHHDDGAEDINLDADSADPGWNLLGSYYFSQGKAVVELVDRSGGKLIIADAVKFIKR